MIGLDDVPFSITFTMRELAEITLLATNESIDIGNPQLRALLERRDTDPDDLSRIAVLTGLVRKIHDAFLAHGIAAMENVPSAAQFAIDNIPGISLEQNSKGREVVREHWEEVPIKNPDLTAAMLAEIAEAVLRAYHSKDLHNLVMLEAIAQNDERAFIEAYRERYDADPRG